MPERFITTAAEWREAVGQALSLLLIGLLVGLGQLLGSKERLTWRIVIGRGLSSGGLAVAAGSALLAFPGMGTLEQFGVAAALASLGTSGLERIIQRGLGIKDDRT